MLNRYLLFDTCGSDLLGFHYMVMNNIHKLLHSLSDSSFGDHILLFWMCDIVLVSFCRDQSKGFIYNHKYWWCSLLCISFINFFKNKFDNYKWLMAYLSVIALSLSHSENCKKCLNLFLDLFPVKMWHYLL